MRKHILQIALAGILLSTAALSPAAEPEVVWPQEWTAFGPIPSKTAGTGLYGRPRKADLLPGETLKTIPRELVIGGQKYQGQPVPSGGRRIRIWDGSSTVAATARAPISWRRSPRRPTPRSRSAPGPTGGCSGGWTASRSMTRWATAMPATGPPRSRAGTMCLPSSWPRAGTSWPWPCSAIANSCLPSPARSSCRSSRSRSRRSWRPAGANTGPRTGPSPSDFAAARTDFERAVELAATDAEQAEARLAIAESYLLDVQNLAATDAPAIRQQCSTVLALKGARAEQKAQAALCVGQTWLLENRCDQARAEFTKAGELWPRPGWTETVQLAIANAHAQDKKDAAARTVLTQLLAAPNLDRLLRFKARSLLEALDVAPRIRPDHPRLFFNADTWPAVKARIERDGEGFKRLQQMVQRLAGGARGQRLGIGADDGGAGVSGHRRRGAAGEDPQDAAGHYRPLPVAARLQRACRDPRGLRSRLGLDVERSAAGRARGPGARPAPLCLRPTRPRRAPGRRPRRARSLLLCREHALVCRSGGVAPGLDGDRITCGRSPCSGAATTTTWCRVSAIAWN